MTHTQSNPTPAPSLADVALLVNLSLSVAPKRKQRRDIARDVATRANASDPNAVAAWVDLIPSGVLRADADPWKIGSAARQENYRLTLPYGRVRGVRLLPAALMVEHARIMSGYRTQFEVAADRLAAAWDDVRQAAADTRGGVFRPEDYPDAADIRRRFSFTFERSPLPTGGNALSTLTDPLADRLREHWEERIRADVAASQAAALDDAADALEHLADAMQSYNPDARKESPFRDSTVRKIYGIADLLPSFNVLSCPDTARIADGVADMIVRADTPESWAEAARQSAAMRLTVEQDAAALAAEARTAARRHREVTAANVPAADPMDAGTNNGADFDDAADAFAALG